MRITKSLGSSSVTTGAGTANTVSKYTAAAALGNSSITDDGTTASIGGKFSVTEATGLPVKSNNIALVGQGFPLIVAQSAATALNAADTNRINYTPPAVAGVYRLTYEVDVTTATTDNFHFVGTWKGATGDALSQTLGGSDKLGTGLIAGAITNTIGVGAYYGSVTFAIDNSGTAITLSTVGTFTTVVYNITAILERLV